MMMIGGLREDVTGVRTVRMDDGRGREANATTGDKSYVGLRACGSDLCVVG